MSATTATIASFSEKFQKELAKFTKWIETTDIKVGDIVDGSEISWKDISIPDFEEPGRNKLENFIKEVMKHYFVNVNGEEINDIKMITKDFRENKPKRSRKQDLVSDGSESDKKLTKKQKTETPKKVEKENAKKSKKVEENGNFDVVVDKNFDTNDTEYFDTLSFTTQELVRCFGKPIFTPDEEEYQYEWKLMVGSKLFSIYNWLNDDNKFDKFEECEWYLGGTDKNKQKQEQVYLLQYVKDKKDERVEDVIDKQDEVEINQVEDVPEDLDDEEVNLNEHIDESIDIELDLIDDNDLEINIDDIDFDL